MNKFHRKSPKPSSSPPLSGPYSPAVQWLQANGRPLTLSNWLGLAYGVESLDELDPEAQAEVPWELLTDEPNPPPWALE